MNRRVLISAGASLLLASTPLWVGAPSGAQTNAVAYKGGVTYGSGQVAALTDSAKIAGPAMATGDVTNKAGAPVVDVPVVLVAWPSDDVMSKMKVGDEFTLQPVAQTSTAADGSFELRPESVEALRPYATKDDGLVSMQVIVGDKTETAPYGFSTKLTPADATNARAFSVTSEGADTTVAHSDFVIGDATQAPVANEDTGVSTATAPTGGKLDMACKATIVSNPKALNLIMVQYSKDDAANMWASYTSSATSSTGWGYSVSGANGSWSQKGKKTAGSDSTVGFAKKSGSGVFKRITTRFYNKIKSACQTYSGGPYNKATYDLLPSQNVGGPLGEKLGPANVPAAIAGSCAPIEGGGTYDKKSTTATEWTNGIDWDSAFSVDFSSQSGYTSSVVSGWKNTAPGARRLCGITGSYQNPGTLSFR